MAGEKAFDDKRYMIKKDECAGTMRDWFMEGPVDIPDDDGFGSDIGTPTFSYDSSRRFRVETKEHIKNVRHLPSPDGFDALSMTHDLSVHNLKPGRPKSAPPRGSWRVSG
jgi:hypothetical protein